MLKIWHTTKVPKKTTTPHEVVLLSLETSSIRATLMWPLRDYLFPRVIDRALYSFDILRSYIGLVRVFGSSKRAVKGEQVTKKRIPERQKIG